MPGRIVQTLPARKHLIQWLDSLKVEASGKICVATLVSGGITVFTPDGETDFVEVPIPTPPTSALAVRTCKDVWITASGTGKIYKARWPMAGLKLAFTA